MDRLHFKVVLNLPGLQGCSSLALTCQPDRLEILGAVLVELPDRLYALLVAGGQHGVALVLLALEIGAAYAEYPHDTYSQQQVGVHG
jgi:hypothetical protein